MTNAGAALGARTARACDGCMRRRARWHCAADDAYLCQACDASVHSANPLARRHHRVRLSSSASSSSSSPAAASSQHAAGPDAPAWLHGLRRRPRTPRRKPGRINGSKQQHDALGTKAASAPVPDLEADDESLSGIILGAGNEVDQLADEDDDLLYQVPVLDPMLAELYSHPMPADDDQKPCCFAPLVVTELSSSAGYGGVSGLADGDGFSGFDLVPDMELASFAADMESLLMGAVDSGYDDLGFLDDEKPQMSHHLGFDDMQDDFESTVAPAPQEQQHQEDRKRKRPDQMILKLDYDGVISSWTHHGASPWFYGERPHLDPSSDSWLDFPAGSGRGFGLGAAVTAVTGGEREARVSRYREKRRTRLFAKKIRYEVRKLNAEKRPRMKGRFVKRAALPPLPPRATPMVLAAPHGGAHGRYRL